MRNLPSLGSGWTRPRGAVPVARYARRYAHVVVALLCCLTLTLPAARPTPAGAETPVSRLQATAMSVAEVNVDRQAAVVRPSPLYVDGMWLRDSFYITAALGDAKLSQRVFEQFATLQRDDGNIPNSTYFGVRDPDYKVDDSALFFLIWAYRDAKLYKVEYDRTVLNKTLKFVLANMYEGRYVTPAGVSHSWLDTLRYREPDVIAHNQGLLAVALRGAKTLGLQVREDEIAQAEAAYRGLYRTDLGYMPHSLRLPYRDTSVLVGEFFSLWLFGQPMLADESVTGTLRGFVATPAGFKNLADRDGNYLNKSAFEPEFYPGDYQNGASWFLYDYLSLAAGIMHDVSGARDALRWRVDVELRPGDDLREYLQTNWELPYYLSAPPTRSRYGWNAFAVVATDLLAKRGAGIVLDAAPKVAVTNEEIPFMTAYRRYGGDEVLGSPMTGRFVWKGSVVQVFQRGVLAAFPGSQNVWLVNLFDEMHREDFDDRLSSALSTPKRLPDTQFTGTPEEQQAARLALLDANDAIKRRYNALPDGLDPVAVYGLPTSPVEDRGEMYVIRLQRTVIQEWKVNVAWAKAGDTTVANAGEVALLVGFFRDWIPTK